MLTFTSRSLSFLAIAIVVAGSGITFGAGFKTKTSAMVRYAIQAIGPCLLRDCGERIRKTQIERGRGLFDRD